jgi:predicted PurR-regulated permease PerM
MKNQVDQARWLAVLAVTAIALYLCWLMLRPFLGVVAWAIVLVIVFYPVHKRLAIRIKRRGLCALVSCLLVVLIIVLPLVVLTIAVAEELGKAVPAMPAQFTGLLNSQLPLFGRFTGWLQNRFGVDMIGAQGFAIEQLRNFGQRMLGASFNIVGNIVGGIVKAVFVVFTMYYLFRDSDKIVAKLPNALPLKPAQSEQIIARAQAVVSASVYGVVTIAGLQGLLGGLAFWILGIPSPILWAVLMAFVCMIPLAGSFLVWLPLAIYLMATGHWTKAIILIVWGAVVISTVDNFLRPRLLRNQTKLHELFVFFSVLGGISVFGILGIVLGPVVLAITLALLHTFQLRHTEA